jgi:hypothetical protein
MTMEVRKDSSHGETADFSAWKRLTFPKITSLPKMIGIKRLGARLAATLCLKAQHWLERGKDYERSIFQ